VNRCSGEQQPGVSLSHYQVMLHHVDQRTLPPDVIPVFLHPDREGPVRMWRALFAFLLFSPFPYSSSQCDPVCANYSIRVMHGLVF